MAIRIVRNEAGNCINFFGASNPTYWNACLSGEVDTDVTSSVNVINDIITAETGETEYEFFRIPYTELTDRDGNGFSSPQEAADYITTNANVIGQTGVGRDLTGQTVCFSLDDTNTSIILDNGEHYGVNAIKAVVDTDGTIHIKSILGDITYFTGIEPGNACIHTSDNVIPGGINDVTNTLNELFTVGAFTAVVISDPFSTLVADVSGSVAGYVLSGSTVVDPVGDDIATNSTSGNYAGLLSVATIDQAGEYFTFDIRGEGQIGFGLVHTSESYANGRYSGNAIYANPTSFAVGNSAHYGFQFSHWFHPTPNGPWTNYGANTSYNQGPGWTNNPKRFNGSDEGNDWLAGNPVKMKVGIDANGFIEIAYYDVSETDWVMCARTSYPVAQGAEFKLGVKFANSAPRVFTEPKVHLLEPEAPTMYFRYAESPDNNFRYPLFATQEEANYYDEVEGGSGTSTALHLPDDPTNTTWYHPTTGYVSTGSAAPTSAITFEGTHINWTEITTLTDQDLTPPAYTQAPISINEGASINIQVTPQDVTYTTTIIDNDNLGVTLVGGFNVEGTAPQVTGDNVSNPSDSYDVTVRRTNAYGSTDGTLSITVVNTTAPQTSVSGSTAVIGGLSGSSEIMLEGSMFELDHSADEVGDGERFVIPKEWVEANVLPFISESGDKYLVGFVNNGFDTGSADVSDFDFAISWEYNNGTSHNVQMYRDGVSQDTFEVISMTNAYYDYAIELSGSSAYMIADNQDKLNTEHSPGEGGTFDTVVEVTSYDTDGGDPHIHFAAIGMKGGLVEGTSELSVLTTPAAPVSNLTNWNKALDFSGGAERTQMVSTAYAYNPLKMNGTSNQVAAPTAGQTVSSGHPWATAIVFNIDGNSSNQHIWNLGEGAGSTDDNIYLRLDASQNLYFGWGRDGDYNECKIMLTTVGSGWDLTPGYWYGIYVAHNGTRYGTGNTASQLAAAFDIRLMGSSDSFGSLSSNLSLTPQSNGGGWNTVGGRMNRQYQGDFTVGGRGGNRNFHGKVASMVVTTLKCGVAMPTDAEIEKMITDPMGWIEDYKKGSTFRKATQTTSTSNWNNANLSDRIEGTQVWLMGDGTNDSYANMIRNQVYPADQNYTKMNMINMVSNDIQNVTIAGLS